MWLDASKVVAAGSAVSGLSIKEWLGVNAVISVGDMDKCIDSRELRVASICTISVLSSSP